MGRFDHKCPPGKRDNEKTEPSLKKRINGTDSPLPDRRYFKLPCFRNETIIPPCVDRGDCCYNSMDSGIVKPPFPDFREIGKNRYFSLFSTCKTKLVKLF